MKQDTWGEYHKLTNGRSPRKLLVSALPYVSEYGKALDLGAGDLVDSMFLVSKGFSVIAIDSSPSSLAIYDKVSMPGLTFEHISFEKYHFPLETFNLISAQFSLPFNKSEIFHKLFQDIKRSLKKDGLLVINLFGTGDEWNKGGAPDMNFHTKEQVEGMLSDMEIIQLSEIEEDKETAAGVLKHWHVFNIIAKK